MARVRVAFALLIFLIGVAGCSGGSGGGGLTPAPVTSVPVSSPGTASSPAPSSVHIAEIITPDSPAGGMVVARDGAVYMNAGGHFLRYTGSFTQYAYPSQQGGSTFALPGLNTIANGPGGAVWTILQETLTGGVPLRYSGALTPATGNIVESSILTTFQDDGLISVGPAANGLMWVNGYQLASGIAFINNGFTDIENAAVKSIGSFNTPDADVLNAMTFGPDGALYVANDPFYNSTLPSRIFRVNPVNNAITATITLPAGSNVQQLASGPDGALWFTDSGLNKIGRMTTGGHVTYYNIPSANGGLSGITAASDGALWFTETAANKIGRISTAGSVTEYSVPSSGAQPQGISAGAPGACIPGTVYFTEKNALGVLTFTS